MKRINSIFVKTGLWMMPVVLLLDLLVLFLSYNITYNNNLEIYKNQIHNAAKMTVQYCESYNLYENMEAKGNSANYNEICDSFDITYVFVVEPNIEKRSEKYLAIGFGEDAAQEVKDSRFPGVIVEGYLSDSEIEAYNGNADGVFLHEKGYFGETLLCYMPCTKYYSSAKAGYVPYDSPLIVGAEINLTRIVRNFQEQFRRIAVLTVSLTLLILAAFGVILYIKVSRPIRRISKRMSSFVSDREKGIEKLDIKGSDEFAQMSRAFNTMTDEINSYISKLDSLTREKHMQEAELNIARRIQMGLLRPDRLDGEGLLINAYMLPAKDVGGDLYDYQQLSDGKIFVAVADVSGKGISAALFMARAITLLHQYMQMDYTPAQILKLFNNTLASQNPGGLFITTFLAVWDPSTGILTYSNAGHNYPYILSEKLITLTGAHSVAAGLFAGAAYEDATVLMQEGDMLFLYTDGVNEAKNAEDAFYTAERLEDRLTVYTQTDKADTLNSILRDLTDFTSGAEQNDDITMLTMQIKPAPAGTLLRLRSELTQLPRVKEAILALDVSNELKMSVCLAAEEIFVNICSYAYDVPGEVELRLRQEDAGVSLTFTDSGKPFDPTAGLPDIEAYDHENAVGGPGRFLTFSVADRCRYAYCDNKNILYLYFREAEPNSNNK